MALFGSEFQGGSHLEVFTTQGSHPLANWKVSGNAEPQRLYDKEVKGYIYHCSAIGSKLLLPKDEKRLLGLTQPYILFQV
jgi:hypothetical protein